MGTGFRGTFVISWSQTEVDGLQGAPLDVLAAGASWAWSGEAVRIDGPSDLLQLGQSDEVTEIRQRAASKVRRLAGQALGQAHRLEDLPDDSTVRERGFLLTNGPQSFFATMIELGRGLPPLLMFLDQLPPRNAELWVVRTMLGRRRPEPDHAGQGGFICFTPGTLIRTPMGLRPVEALQEGDYVDTKDCGAQPVLWTGSRRLTGARLHAMPWLRPIRISAGAFGVARPDRAFMVSPEHRLLVQGPVARALFNTSEVLVAARDLLQGSAVARDMTLPEVTYIHLLLPAHQIIWANGIETESFHPANAALDQLGTGDRARLLSGMPSLGRDPASYGGFARRNLSAPEAAILMRDAA